MHGAATGADAATAAAQRPSRPAPGDTAPGAADGAALLRGGDHGGGDGSHPGGGHFVTAH